MKEYLLNIRNNIWFPFISLAFAVMIYRSGKLYIILALFTVAFSLICAFLCNNLIKNAFAQKSRLIVSALAALVVSAITVKLFIIRLTVSRRFFLVIQKLDMQKELVLYGCSILLGLFAFAFLTVGLTIVFRAIKRFVIDNNFKIKPKALATNFIKKKERIKECWTRKNKTIGEKLSIRIFRQKYVCVYDTSHCVLRFMDNGQ